MLTRELMLITAVCAWLLFVALLLNSRQKTAGRGPTAQTASDPRLEHGPAAAAAFEVLRRTGEGAPPDALCGASVRDGCLCVVVRADDGSYKVAACSADRTRFTFVTVPVGATAATRVAVARSACIDALDRAPAQR